LIAFIIITIITVILYFLFWNKKTDHNSIVVNESDNIKNSYIKAEGLTEDEIFTDENGQYKIVEKTREIPRRTYIKAVLNGKYWGEIDEYISNQFSYSKFFNFNVYEVTLKNAVYGSSPYPLEQDLRIPRERLPKHLHTVLEKDKKEYDVNLHEPVFADIKFNRKLHQSDGNEVFGTIDAVVTGYVLDYTKEITFEKAIELYSIHYSGMPINKVNPDYLKYIINEDTSFIHYSCLNINFRGVNKKIVLLGELHSNEKYNKELVYIKNEFRKICQWNNTNKTNIKVDFLSESTELSNILMLENEQYNIRELVKCTDDENIKKLLTFKNLKFSIPNEYDEFTKERTCNMNKCFYDVYYNSLDYRYISSNYFIKNTDFESYEKFLYRNIFIDYLKTHSNVEKFTNDLYKKVENAINYMKNESLYYNYNTNNNFMVFGYLYEKNSDYAKSLFELYMNSISNNYNILLNYFSFPLNVVQILSKHILDIPPQIVFDYMIYDICNFYNYIYKNYFPYIYYEYRQNPDFTNKVTDLYQRYKHFYGYFPEESSLKKLKNFYTNDLNIFEYKYCKYLIECMVYIDDGFITRYIFLSFKMYNEPLFLSLFIYDPFLQKYLIYMAYLDRLATIRCSYIDVFLIHNILLSNNTEFKKNKKIPSNNNNIVVYCGALHARTLISCFSEIKILNNDNYFCLDDYFTTGNGFVHLNKIPCFSNFLLK